MGDQPARSCRARARRARNYDKVFDFKSMPATRGRFVHEEFPDVAADMAAGAAASIRKNEALGVAPGKPSAGYPGATSVGDRTERSRRTGVPRERRRHRRWRGSSHSGAAPDFIAEQVAASATRHGAGPGQSFLLYRGINDVYLSLPAASYAPRVWRRGFREIGRGRLRSTDSGGKNFRFGAAARPRPLAVLQGRLARGRARAGAVREGAGEVRRLPRRGTAFRIGAVFAQLHRHGIEYRWPVARTTWSRWSASARTPALLDFVYDRPDDVRDFARASARTPARRGCSRSSARTCRSASAAATSPEQRARRHRRPHHPCSDFDGVGTDT